MAFKVVCNVPNRNLLKMPVHGNCHDMCLALLSHSLVRSLVGTAPEFEEGVILPKLVLLANSCVTEMCCSLFAVF